MTSTTRRSRVPDIPAIDKAHYEFLDGLDKRQRPGASLRSRRQRSDRRYHRQDQRHAAEHTPGRDNMGWWSSFTGKTGADAAKAAAADHLWQAAERDCAAARLRRRTQGRLRQHRRELSAFTSIRRSGSPASRTKALYHLSKIRTRSARCRPISSTSKEGQRAIDRAPRAQRHGYDGRTLKDLTRFGTGLADQTYGNQLSRLLGLNQQGFSQGCRRSARKTALTVRDCRASSARATQLTAAK
jgi:hypothetical protein